MIDPKIWVNLKVGSLPDAGRLLFIGIFSTADDDGRLEADPKFLKATIFPYDDQKTIGAVRELRDDCARLGLIRVYSKNSREYLDIPGWHEHQMIRKDRYNPSKHPNFDNADKEMATNRQPDDNQMATSGDHSIVKSSIVKSSIVKSSIDTPKGARIKRADPIVNEIFTEMRTYLGYPDKVKEDPIPSYGKEGQAIKRMLTRGFTREEILDCWKAKASQRGGEFVSMTWVNEDISKKSGKAIGKQSKQERRRPITYIRGSEPAGTEDTKNMR